MELKEVMAWEYFGINKRHKSLGLRLMSPWQELNEQNKTNLNNKMHYSETAEQQRHFKNQPERNDRGATIRLRVDVS